MFDGSIFDINQSTNDSKQYGLFLLIIGVSIALGLLISFVYMRIYKKKASQSFILTLIILPPIVTSIIYFVGSNIASAFSLAGAFAIIRFRSEPGDTKDIAYVLFTMAVGLACGMGYIFYGLIIGATLCALVIIMHLTKFGQAKTIDKVLKITLPEDMEFDGAFDDLFEKYTTQHSLFKIKTTELGSLYVAEYEVTLKKDVCEKSFIDELRCRNGNLSISVGNTSSNW